VTARFPKHLAKVLGPEGDVRRGSSLINASEVSVPWKGIENYRKVQHISWIFNDFHAVSQDFTLPTPTGHRTEAVVSLQLPLDRDWNSHSDLIQTLPQDVHLVFVGQHGQLSEC